jgi:hypothetical protein
MPRHQTMDAQVREMQIRHVSTANAVRDQPREKCSASHDIHNSSAPSTDWFCYTLAVMQRLCDTVFAHSDRCRNQRYLSF